MSDKDEGFIAHPIDRASRISGISRSKLYELVVSGELSFIKIGRRSLISDSDLRTLIERHRAPKREANHGAVIP